MVYTLTLDSKRFQGLRQKVELMVIVSPTVGVRFEKKVISSAKIGRSGLTFSIALKAHGSSNYMRILYSFIFALKVFLFIPRVFAALSWLPPVSLRTIAISELSTSESTVS